VNGEAPSTEILLVGPPAKPKATARTRCRSAGEESVYENGGRWRSPVTWTEPDCTRRRRIVTGETSGDARDKLEALVFAFAEALASSPVAARPRHCPVSVS
jgi:hypothetical protein